MFCTDFDLICRTFYTRRRFRRKRFRENVLIRFWEVSQWLRKLWSVQRIGLANFLSHAYEKLCLTYLEYLSKNGRLNGLFVDFRNFEFVSLALGRSVEVDTVSDERSHLLLAEMKFSSKKRTIRDYYDMLEDLKAEPFRPYKQVELYLFGAGGFEDSLLSLDDPRLHLIDLPTMFKEIPPSI